MALHCITMGDVGGGFKRETQTQRQTQRQRETQRARHRELDTENHQRERTNNQHNVQHFDQ
jgi:hypothetical protein